MGVEVSCKKTGYSMTLGYGGFFRWRLKIAELCDTKWYDHYKKLVDAPLSFLDKEWYNKFNKETERLIDQEGVDVRLVDFCIQSDCGGSITYGTCKKILKLIGDYTDDIAYTYLAYADHDWDKLKAILQECADTRSRLVWY